MTKSTDLYVGVLYVVVIVFQDLYRRSQVMALKRQAGPILWQEGNMLRTIRGTYFGKGTLN